MIVAIAIAMICVCLLFAAVFVWHERRIPWMFLAWIAFFSMFLFVA